MQKIYRVDLNFSKEMFLEIYFLGCF